MRRKDCERDQEFAYSVIDECEYGSFSMVLEDGSPYCVVLSTVRKDDTVYVHAAKQGLKLDCLRKNPKVCASFVCGVETPKNSFTSAYKTAVIFGEAVEIFDKEEQIEILRLLCEKLVPTNMENFQHTLDLELHITSVWAIKISSVTGKQKSLPVKKA